MLIRVGGGTGGIKEYLERGQKQGRSFTRDQLDERLVLAGNLKATDTIIQHMKNSGEKYRHITLSFKEDAIDHDTLLAITRDFEAFAFAAFKPEEYSFYAEAHLPKIKSYANEKDGEFVERKPHIHIVIPKLNLFNGHHLNPFGMVERQVQFIDAFQEHINAKYGLASPKDNRRIPFTGESEIISRHKGDVFGGQGSNLKHAVLNAMLECRIERYEDFIAMLPEFGVTRIRNAGKPSAYPNVKAHGATKGINLKDYVFSREFVELPIAEKQQRLNAEVENHYESVQAPQATPQHLERILTEWREVRAKEIKYLNSGNKVVYAHYRAADEPTRHSLLAAREAQFYAKFEPKEPYGTRKRNPKHQHIEPIATLVTAPTLDRVRSLSTVPVVRFERGTQVLLPSHAPDRVEHPRIQPTDALRRLNAIPTDIAEFKVIRSQLDARALLEALALSHGVIREKYAITKAKDGSDRIQCGTRHLNVSDFLTKEMNLPWAESAKILRDCYAQQLEHLVQVREPRQQLWSEFQAHRAATATERKAAIKREFLRTKTEIQADNLSPAQKKARMSIARMDKVQHEAALRDTMSLYRAWLAERAKAGEEVALAELRRMREREETKATNAIEAGESVWHVDTAPAPIIRHWDFTYQIDHLGNVTYQQNGQDVLRDVGQRLDVIQQTEDSIEVALRLGVQKFGGTLSLYGSEEFQRKVVAVAVERGVLCRFDNPALESLKRELLERQKAAYQHKDGTHQSTDLPNTVIPRPIQTKEKTKGCGR